MRIDGKVRKRPAGTENPDLPTGAIEVFVDRDRGAGAGGRTAACRCSATRNIRRISGCKYRFLDLRRERLHRNIMMRGADHRLDPRGA